MRHVIKSIVKLVALICVFAYSRFYGAVFLEVPLVDIFLRVSLVDRFFCVSLVDAFLRVSPTDAFLFAQDNDNWFLFFFRDCLQMYFFCFL